MSDVKFYTTTGRFIFKSFESYDNFCTEWEKATTRLKGVKANDKRTNKRIKK